MDTVTNVPPTRVNALAELADLSEEDAARFFAECDAEAVVRLIEVADDTELRRLAAQDHVRTAAVRGILARLPEFSVPARLAEIAGVVHFEVTTPKAEPERHGLLFDGAVAVVDASEHEADVVIRSEIVDFLHLVSGTTNAALLLLGGALSVEGDAMLALAVGGVFRVPGKPGVAVDPAEVDPVDVARVVKRSKDAHLRDVMAGGFRPVILEQVFGRFPEFLDTEKAAGVQLTIGFKITGRPDDGADHYVVRIDDGSCAVEADPSSGKRDATLTVSGANFLKVVTGQLNPVTAVMKGTVKVKGNVKAALHLHRIMQIPEA